MSKSYLFIGTEDFTWGPANFDPPIALCKKYGITGLLVKAYEITQGFWYGGISGFDAIFKRIIFAGLECVPYGFFYGGAGLPAEAAAGLLFMGKYGAFCMDSESAFDGHTDWGQALAAIWANHPGQLWVSTWANPADHHQLGFIEALRPHVQVWMPQVYSDKLAVMALAQWPHFLSIQPTVGIVGDGDPNTGARYAHLFGNTDISIWEYQEGVAHSDKLQAIMHAFGAQPLSPPVPVAQPFPMVSERTGVTGDLHPSENAGLNCVPASLLAGVMWLLGKTQLDSTFNPDALKDAVYGQGYVGGMAASAYVTYLAKQFGITLASFKGTPVELVQRTHAELKAGHPVVMTIPNPYGNPRFTHVCVFHSPEHSGELTVMDPWPPKDITRSDADWEALLLDNEVWVMSTVGGDMILPLTINDVKQFFTVNPDGSWTRIDSKTGLPVLDGAGKPIILHGEMLTDWCNHGTLALADIGLPEANEFQSDPAHPEVVDQRFERCIRRFDKGHIEDSPPHAGHVYSTHIEGLYSAQDKLTMALNQLATVEKQLAAAVAAGANPESAYVAAVKETQVHIKAIAAVIDPLAV